MLQTNMPSGVVGHAIVADVVVPDLVANMDGFGWPAFRVRGQPVLSDQKPATKTLKPGRSRDLVTRPKDRRVRMRVLHFRAADDYTTVTRSRWVKNAPVACTKEMHEALTCWYTPTTLIQDNKRKSQARCSFHHTQRWMKLAQTRCISIDLRREISITHGYNVSDRLKSCNTRTHDY